MVQGELFREDGSFQPAIEGKHSFLSQYRVTLGLDKVLLLALAMIFIFTLSFSFGVEKGKRSMEQKMQSLIPAHVQTFGTDGVSNDSREIVEAEATITLNPSDNTQLKIAKGSIQLNNVSVAQPNDVRPSKSELKKLGRFTVQLVTYDNQGLAEKEIARLKEKGYEGFVIPSGRFYQVCANYFDNKSQARTDLETLKGSGRYPGAYIRPVVR